MKLKERLKKHPYRYAVMALVVGGGIWYWYSHRAVVTPTQYSTAAVEKKTIIASVSGAGQVSTLKRLDLKPQTSGTTNQGTLIQMNVVPSQKVKAGQVVAVIDDTNALVALQKAQASLISAQANYNKVVNGATETDLASARRSVEGAKISLQNSQNNLASVTQQQNTAVSNALRSLLSTGAAAQLNNMAPFTSSNVTQSDAPIITGSYAGTVSGTYYIVQQGAYFSVSGLETQAMQKFDVNVPMALGVSGLYVQFKNPNITAQWDVAIPNPQSGSYVSNLSSYNSALFNREQALASARNSVSSSQLSLANAEDSLAKLLAPAEAQDIASAKASLINAQSQLRTAESDYSNTRIKAPFDGQIAAVNSQKGDQVSGSTVIATLITEQKIAEVSLNEVDAAKVKVGDQVTLTFDAIPDLSITGKVSQIDLLGTVSQGVVNYAVQIYFDTQDERVRPDMSVSASIITDTRPDVLAVPSTAVKTANGVSYVMVVEDNNIATKNGNNVTLKSTPKNVSVTTGLAGESYTEIKDGLVEGEMVVTRTITSQTQTSGSSNNSLRIPGLGGGGGGGGFRGN